MDTAFPATVPSVRAAAADQVVEIFVIPGRGPSVREPGIQLHTQCLPLDSGLALFTRTPEWRKPEVRLHQPASLHRRLDERRQLGESDAAKVRDLDLFVKALASDEANNEKPLVWFFDEAHRRVLALHGSTATPTPAPVTPG